MKDQLFAALEVYHDDSARLAALNMALDEALLECASVPSIRFYKWDSPALSFGYFGRFADVAAYAPERDLVRRWTGGGIVFHGEDLTYSIVIPANDALVRESSLSIYEKIHSALRDVLLGSGTRAHVAPVAALYERRTNFLAKRHSELTLLNNATVSDRGYNEGHCFANPVRGDVLLNGRKIAGAAQRRTRAGLLQQGSIQLAAGRVRPTGGHVDLANGLAEQFAQALSAKCERREIESELLRRAQAIASQRYATDAWLRKR
jgi:lipoyl(octanoyl) transferase